MRRLLSTVAVKENPHPSAMSSPGFSIGSTLVAARTKKFVLRGRAGHIDLLDATNQTSLFLCCSHHVVPCQKCQNTYQFRWIPRAGPDVFPCPLCGNDLTPTVVAHAQVCRYWAPPGTETTESPITVGAHDTSIRAATG